MDNEMTITFTSFRDSITVDGLKLSIDRHPPRPCSYPTLQYLSLPAVRSLDNGNIGKIYGIILENNWVLLKAFVEDMYRLGIRSLVLCCWCTADKIAEGKVCIAPVIGKHLRKNEMEFDFPIKIIYRDGR